MSTPDTRNPTARPGLRLAAAAAALAAVVVPALLLGSVPITPADVLTAFTAPSAGEGNSMAVRIVRLIRMPRVATAAGAGAALGLAGLLLQTVFRNALAGPGVLGVSAGAGLGVALILLTGLGTAFPLTTVPAAMAGAAAVLSLALAVNRVVGHPIFLLVLGLLFGYVAGALTTLVMASASGQGLQRYVVWSFGSFALAPGTGPRLLVFGSLVVTASLTAAGRRIDALLLGAHYAESSGVHARRTQGVLIAVAGALTGLVTAYAGPISFLGVAVPHVARGWMGSSRHRLLVPATALVGAFLAVAADLVSRLPGSDRVLPLNAVMALVGVPVVLLVVMRSHSGGNGEGMGL